MNVNIIKTLVEDITGESGGHECHHERKHVLHVTSSLQEDDCKGDSHSSHTSQHFVLICRENDISE